MKKLSSLCLLTALAIQFTCTGCSVQEVFDPIKEQILSEITSEIEMESLSFTETESEIEPETAFSEIEPESETEAEIIAEENPSIPNLNVKTTILTELAKKPLLEIIQMMNGEYTIHIDVGEHYYLENEEVFPSLQFYLNTNDYYAGYDVEINENTEFIQKLESGEFQLYGIELDCRENTVYPLTDPLTDALMSNYSYTEFAEQLGEFSCVPGTSGMCSGDLGSAKYSFEENGCEIELKFNIENEAIYTALTSSGTADAQLMREINPSLVIVEIYPKKIEEFISEIESQVENQLEEILPEVSGNLEAEENVNY